MLSALFSAASGMSVQKTRLDVAGNNVANASSVGYKSKSVQLANDGPELGVHVAGVRTSRQQGALARTDVPTDMAISGSGYFRVENEGGTPFYTRSGNFTKDGNGYLRTASGEFLLGDSGRVQIPADTANFSIASNGKVTAVDYNGNSSTVATIQLAAFGNEEGLASIGNGLYSASPAAGTPQVGNPGSNGAGTLQSGALELSNVDFVSEMVTMTMANRSFEANTKTFKAANEMLESLMEAME